MRFKKSMLNQRIRKILEDKYILPNTGKISLKDKTKTSSFNARNNKVTALHSNLVYGISNENILETPSSMNENPPPLSLDLLDQSLNNYYELEINRESSYDNSIALVPGIIKRKKTNEHQRSFTPNLKERYAVDNRRLEYQGIVGGKNSTSTGKKKSLSPLLKDKQNASKTRYFSRRERKSKPSDTIKFIYYYHK